MKNQIDKHAEHKVVTMRKPVKKCIKLFIGIIVKTSRASATKLENSKNAESLSLNGFLATNLSV